MATNDDIWQAIMTLGVAVSRIEAKLDNHLEEHRNKDKHRLWKLGIVITCFTSILAGILSKVFNSLF